MTVIFIVMPHSFSICQARREPRTLTTPVQVLQQWILRTSGQDRQRQYRTARGDAHQESFALPIQLRHLELHIGGRPSLHAFPIRRIQDFNRRVQGSWPFARRTHAVDPTPVSDSENCMLLSFADTQFHWHCGRCLLQTSSINPGSHFCVTPQTPGRRSGRGWFR